MIPSGPIESSAAGLLALRGVCVGYRQDGRAGLILEDVSLEVVAGQSVAVVGQRWEGKTTLLELAAGMKLAEAGTVHYDDAADLIRRMCQSALNTAGGWVLSFVGVSPA